MQGPRREGTQVAAEIHRKPVKSAFYDQVRTIPRESWWCHGGIILLGVRYYFGQKS